MQPEVIIIGSGIGGATFAAGLAPTGRRVLILERGDFLAGDGLDRDSKAIFEQGHFKSDEQWLDGEGNAFNPGNYYMVGGNSKLYGGSLVRFRAEDFAPRQHPGGVSAGWPITYHQLEPYYGQAESLFRVRGPSAEPTDDPTEPYRSYGFPFPPVGHEPDIEWLAGRLRSVGLNPASIPLGVDRDAWLAGGATPWDGFPNIGQGKIDAETGPLTDALRHDNVELRTGARVRRLECDDQGMITAAVVEAKWGAVERIHAKTFVLAAGAVQSAALLLGSASQAHPNGLANGSDQVGRNFMNHNASAIMALHPLRRNRAVYQKTLMVNDFYHQGTRGEGPLGNVQMLGKISGGILRANAPGIGPLADFIADRSFDFYAMSEDLPDPESRITLRGDQVVLNWKRTNWEAHTGLVKAFTQVLRRAGLPVVLSRAFDHRTPSHQCGTARMGEDPKTSVVKTLGQAHEHKNLIIADASVLPTSAAMNPSLTIAALALRSAQAYDQGRIGK